MRKLIVLFALSLAVLAIMGIKSNGALAASNNNLIDDGTFDNSNSMSAATIDSWLNSNFPNSCISTNSGFSAPEPMGYTPTSSSWYGKYSYGNPVSAGKIIYDLAQAHNINPQVLLTKLQNEEQLVDGSAGCSSTWRYTSAVGYACTDSDTYSHDYSYTGADPYSNPGALASAIYYRNGVPVNSISGSCVNTNIFAGFSEQLSYASWLLSWSRHKSEGQTAWASINGNYNHCDDNNTCPSNMNIPSSWACYSHLMTQGSFKRCPTDSDAIYYDGYATIDGTSVHMDNGATAALYVYTPHIQSFANIFGRWFDPIRSGVTMNNVSQPLSSAALGQTLTYVVSYTNNLSSSLTIDAVGIVGRYGSINGPNRDFGWQGPFTLQAGETKQFTFTSTPQETGNLYVWPAVNYLGSYVHYNNWGALINVHVPNLSLTSSLSSSVPSPVATQSATLTATIKNNESQAVRLDTLGIPVRFMGKYNYDTGWSGSPITIQPGATQTVSGNITFDKPGSYTSWVSAKIGGQYISLSPNLDISVSTVTPKFLLTYIETPNNTPALGEDVTVKFNLKNNSGVPMTLDAIGVVGRYNNPYNGPNRDFGWVGPDTFGAGEEKSYTTFISNVSELNNFYAWVAIRYQGSYIHYNNWGFMMTPHMPNLLTLVPVTVNGGNPPSIGQTVNVTATIKNLETHPIKYSAIGIPGRYYGVYSYDTAWQGAGTLTARGQVGDAVVLNGTTNFDKSGPYTVWTSINIQGRYITIGNIKNINL